MKDNNKSTIFKPNKEALRELFNDDKREVTDNITATTEGDIKQFSMSLWGAWFMSKDGGITDSDVESLVDQFQELERRLSKLSNLAALAQYATVFEIPEHAKLNGINIEKLKAKGQS